MKPMKMLPFVLALVCLALGRPALAEETPDGDRLDEVEKQLEAVTRELERMQLGRDVVEADSSVIGLPYGASKVYRVRQGVALGGYGEFLYENYAREREDGTASGERDQFDALRAVLYVGYKFNDRLLFNSEIEVEHAKEIFLEFAYIEYWLSQGVALRGGLLLAPLGLVNELHEPTYFLGTQRSLLETSIVPTTWRENGVGLVGTTGQFDWRAYVMNSLDGSKFSGSGLRGGRQKGGKALAEDLGFTGRIDYTATDGLLVGVSAYYGQTAQNAPAVAASAAGLQAAQASGGDTVDGTLFLWDVHADYRVRGLILRGMFGMASIADVEELNALNGLAGADGIGSELMGWYVEAGYDVLRHTESTHQLIPFLRYDTANTQSKVADGFAADPANDRTLIELGAQWRPDPRVAAKVGYQIQTNQAETGVNQANFHLAYIF